VPLGTTLAMLTLNIFAAERQDLPGATAAMTRSPQVRRIGSRLPGDDQSKAQ
jgi:hypothetical protein